MGQSVEDFDDGFVEPVVTISPENGVIVSLGSNEQVQSEVLRAIQKQSSDITANKGEPMLESVAISTLKNDGKSIKKVKTSQTKDEVQDELYAKQKAMEDRQNAIESKLDKLLETLAPKGASEDVDKHVEKEVKSDTLEHKSKAPPTVKL